jgi:hypothetical protein
MCILCLWTARSTLQKQSGSEQPHFAFLCIPMMHTVCRKHLKKRVAACSEWRKVVVVLVKIRIVVYHSYSPFYGYVEALPSLSLRFGVL